MRLTFHEQNRGKPLDAELVGGGSEAGAVELAHPHGRVGEGLGGLQEDRLELVAVAAPRRVEHDEPLAVLPNVDEAVSQLDDAAEGVGVAAGPQRGEQE